MLFTCDEDTPSSFWVDQNRYCEVDHFQPCDYCRQWRWWLLCDPCQTNLEITTAIDMARRPELLDLEGRVLNSMAEERLAQAAQMEDLGRTITPGDLLDQY